LDAKDPFNRNLKIIDSIDSNKIPKKLRQAINTIIGNTKISDLRFQSLKDIKNRVIFITNNISQSQRSDLNIELHDLYTELGRRRIILHEFQDDFNFQNYSTIQLANEKNKYRIFLDNVSETEEINFSNAISIFYDHYNAIISEIRRRLRCDELSIGELKIFDDRKNELKINGEYVAFNKLMLYEEFGLF